MTGGMRMDGRNGYWQVLLRVEECMEAKAKTKKSPPEWEAIICCCVSAQITR